MTANNTTGELVYDMHVFCCINERANDHPRGSCAARGSIDLHKYMKVRCKELEIQGIRINKAGCLNRCELGPVLVIYPQAIWYRFENRQDLDEIIDRHLLGGQVVKRLVIKADQVFPEPVYEPRLKLRVEGIKKLATKIRQIEFVAAGGGELPAFTAGSHIDIFTGNDLRRSYSLANDPGQRQCYQIAVLRETGGRGGSAWMHDKLAVGDVIEATFPANFFPLNENADHHLLVAGGIGIAPLLSMGRRLAYLGASFMLYYCTRDPETTAYAREVKEIFGDRVVFHHDGGDPKKGMDLERVLAEPRAGSCLYICGPTGLIEATQKAAAKWLGQSIRVERFTAAPSNPEIKNTDQAFDIVLSRQQKTLTVPVGRSILEVLLGAGIKMDTSCEKGFCGSCRIRVLSGKVDHRDGVLNEEEKQQDNVVIVCSSRAQPGETLVLDI